VTAAEPVRELDCRGQLCPLPVIELARAITDVPVGAVIRLLTDDPAAAVDIPAWCRLRHHDYLGASPTSPVTTHLIRRLPPQDLDDHEVGGTKTARS
jgi:tRNA 2-thiouridine synthesizing protein A